MGAERDRVAGFGGLEDGLRSVPESFLVAGRLTNYWGYKTIGYFAPHEAQGW